MSGDKIFEEQYDLIVLGTGLVQSLVAGAVALTGRKVIHVDKNDFYGEYYSSHSVENFPIGPKSDDNNNVNYQASLTGPTNKNNNENLLYFSQKKLPKLQTYTTKPTHFKGKKLVFQAQKKFPIGSIVDVSPFGLGFISGYTSLDNNSNDLNSSLCAKIIVEWFLTDGKPAVVYLPIGKLSKPFFGQSINTNLFGVGKLWKLRNEDNMMSVNLNWKLANGKDAILMMPQKYLFKSKRMQNLQQTHYNIRMRCSNNNNNNVELENLFQKSNRFCLDIIPSLLLSRGFSVDKIVACGVSNYLEFKPIDGIYIFNEQQIKSSSTICNDNDNTAKLFHKVPCSKSDVFTSSELSMSDKRLLMKFLRYCLDLNEDDALTLNEKSLAKGRSLKRPQNKGVDAAVHDYEKYQDLPFIEFLKRSFGVSASLGKLLIYAIGLLPTPASSATCTTRRGIFAIQKHLLALGRFGSTAFLTTLYGSGEVPQAFCRLSAVNGGIYLLRKSPLGLQYEINKESSEERKIFSGIQLEGNIFVKGKCIVVGNDYYTPQLSISTTSDKGSSHQSSLARSILITTKNVFKDAGKSVFVIPPNSKNIHNNSTIFILQLDPDSYVVPKPYYVIHLTCEVVNCNDTVNSDSENAHAIDSLKRAAIHIFGNHYDDDSASILWSSYFTLSSKSNNLSDNDWDSIENVFVLNGNNSIFNEAGNVGFSKAFCFQNEFQMAESIFNRLCPGEEFLVKPKPIEEEENIEGHRRNPYQNSDDDSDMSGLDIDDSLYSDDD